MRIAAASIYKPIIASSGTAAGIDLINQLAGLGKPVLVFSGGEALMRPDFFTLAHHAQAVGLPTALASNGHGIDRGTARRLARAGIRRVAVSLDGASPATHDDLRQLPGSFEAALAGITALQQEGISTQINCTISLKNLAEKQQILDLALATGVDALHVFFWYLLAAVPNYPPK